MRERTDTFERNHPFQQKLEELNVNCKVESIFLGDFLWINEITTTDGKRESYVMDYVVERKTADDLAASILDHQYKEQKFRYKRSGLKHCFYLIEGNIKNNRQTTATSSTIEAAILSTQLSNGFKVQRTNSLDDTIKWLGKIHLNIASSFDLKYNKLQYYDHLTFESTMKEYQQKNKKNTGINLNEQFRHILNTISGCGSQQIATLLQIFPTPLSLYRSISKFHSRQEMIEFIIQSAKSQKSKQKEQGNEQQCSISRSIANDIAVLFKEYNYPKQKIDY